jgi:Flp pilus assembly pilin Flp
LKPIPPVVPSLRREDGQTIVEYATVLGVVSLMLIGVIATSGLTDDFQALAEAVVDSIFAD